MRDYVILTDSCCDLSAEMAAELGVEILPLRLQMGERAYRNYLDGREIGFHEFYERVRSGELATTSAVNVGEFEEKMREILKTGKDILSISFSSALSTTYQSSVIAAEELKDEFPDAKILTVDSLCASLGQGLFVYLCAQEQKKGKTIDEVKTFAEETKGRVCHWFTVDDLNHLKRGGRINAATALVGQAVGARSREDASSYGKLAGGMGFLMCLGTGALMFLVAPLVSGLFTPDGDVVALTARVLRIVAFSEPFFGLSIVMSGALRGARDVAFPMGVALGCMWGVRATIAPLLIFGFHWGLEAVWLAMALDLTCRGVLCALRWRSGRWTRRAGLTESQVSP